MNLHDSKRTHGVLRVLDAEELVYVVGGYGDTPADPPPVHVGTVTVTGSAVTFVDWGITISFSSINHGDEQYDHEKPIDDNATVPPELLELAQKIAILEQSPEWNKISQKAQDAIYADIRLTELALRFIQDNGKIQIDPKQKEVGRYFSESNTISFKYSSSLEPLDSQVSTSFFVIAHELYHYNSLYGAYGVVDIAFEEAYAVVNALIHHREMGYSLNSAQLDLKYGGAAAAAASVFDNGGTYEEAIAAAKSHFGP